MQALKGALLVRFCSIGITGERESVGAPAARRHASVIDVAPARSDRAFTPGRFESPESLARGREPRGSVTREVSLRTWRVLFGACGSDGERVDQRFLVGPHLSKATADHPSPAGQIGVASARSRRLAGVGSPRYASNGRHVTSYSTRWIKRKRRQYIDHAVSNSGATGRRRVPSAARRVRTVLLLCGAARPVWASGALHYAGDWCWQPCRGCGPSWPALRPFAAVF
jgi:hypothetical protein